MTARTFVVVYAVDESGATGVRLGRATLLEREFALAHPPLSTMLAEQGATLRLGVFSPAHEYGEIVDVSATIVVPDAPDIVLLQLAETSAAPPRGVPVTLVENPEGGLAEPGRDEVIAAVRKVLTEAATATPPPAMSIGNPLTWVWKLLGGG
ncbi:hypothetical protein AB0H76_11995 [Nocardia sp. NPDC050712]|uniref:hypothetical protein n=1 Tax=Nocardia sp. NPDC050712 TaxID=3155518 RepID=UPI0033FE099F